MASRRYSILIVCSEFTPFAKTGGLGDMAAGLAEGLKNQGQDVRVVMPLYRQIRRSGINLGASVESMRVTMGTGEKWCAVRRFDTRKNITVYFIEHDFFFDRSGLYYDVNYRDYQDNPLRFGFFCKAALQLAIELKFRPDIIQVNDWPTALTPAYLKTWFPGHPVLGDSAAVLTIHNESHQGIFSPEHYRWLGLPVQDFQPDIFEDYGRINFLKGGIHFADAVNTVSPTHALEMASPAGSFGLSPYIIKKGARFRGILNGVDYEEWSPEIDAFIPARYSAGDMSGKSICKLHVQRRFNLHENAESALIGFIGRLTLQKGVHLLREAIERIVLDMDVQAVILGSGEPEFEDYFYSLPERYPGMIGSYIGFSNELAHAIEAGADFFLMPSMYEPCGLNQMYSLRYGTLPIVRATGGLEDTVENYDENAGAGAGFKFWEPTGNALYNAVGRAVSVYHNRPDHMAGLRKTAMTKDFSWEKSVRDYLEFFAAARGGE